ncbi:hypothetical protein NPIL_374881 [Nephila pilipes]|uniref:Uncharacterized protein n=1 Tax=Nephila pilipes TaxID=299642 RepID=A0A8X6N3U9_NEPPI|nr:hypothetical protein NPIL_374881 [Nephila pilipes]
MHRKHFKRTSKKKRINQEDYYAEGKVGFTVKNTSIRKGDRRRNFPIRERSAYDRVVLVIKGKQIEGPHGLDSSRRRNPTCIEMEVTRLSKRCRHRTFNPVSPHRDDGIILKGAALFNASDTSGLETVEIYRRAPIACQYSELSSKFSVLSSFFEHNISIGIQIGL